MAGVDDARADVLSEHGEDAPAVHGVDVEEEAVGPWSNELPCHGVDDAGPRPRRPDIDASRGRNALPNNGVVPLARLLTFGSDLACKSGRLLAIASDGS